VSTSHYYRSPSIELGRRVMPSGQPRYARIVTADELCLSVHVPFDATDRLTLSCHNERSDFRPARLTRNEVVALRDALDLYLADRGEAPKHDPVH
jgi:hypothetical protein